MAQQIDIWVDFTSQDDTGLPWTLLSEADAPSASRPGRSSWPATTQASAMVEVVDLATTGVVHLRPLPGTVAANAHLLRTPVT